MPPTSPAPPRPGIGRALRSRNFRLFFGGQSVSLVGTWITRIATSWLVYRLTGSALLLGVVGFCGQIPTLLLAPFAGVLVDRWDRHRILVVTQVLSLLQSAALRSALAPYTLEGPFGRLLDAAEDDLRVADLQCFETEALMGHAGAIAPVLTYLFHRLEERFDGRPTLLVLDEAWIFLDHPLFAQRIREWLKTLRKKNVAVLLATQSLADIAASTIAPAIIESCPQRILLPNDRAIEPQSRQAYERFGLNERQIELVSRASPKRHYYLQSARGNRLFELGLGPIALALCGASDPASQARIDTILAEHGAHDFAARFLESAGLDWAAPLLAGFPQTPSSPE